MQGARTKGLSGVTGLVTTKFYDSFIYADIAMYYAKKSGRNALRFSDPQMQQVINQRVLLESGLRKALLDQQFQLYYQLQVDDSGSPLGAEVLMRCIHPEKGVISPLEFKFGLIR